MTMLWLEAKKIRIQGKISTLFFKSKNFNLPYFFCRFFWSWKPMLEKHFLGIQLTMKRQVP